jgi:hypothetical protein
MSPVRTKGGLPLSFYFDHIEARHLLRRDASCRRHWLSPTMASFSDLFYGIGLIFYSMFCYSSQRSCHGNIKWNHCHLAICENKRYGAQPSTAFAFAAAMKLCFYHLHPSFLHSSACQYRYLRLVRHHELTSILTISGIAVGSVPRQSQLSLFCSTRTVAPRTLIVKLVDKGIRRNT